MDSACPYVTMAAPPSSVSLVVVSLGGETVLGPALFDLPLPGVDVRLQTAMAMRLDMLQCQLLSHKGIELKDSDHVRAEEDGRVCFTVVAVSAELAEKRRQRRQALLEEFNEAREAAERIAASRRSPGFIKTNILDALCLTLPKNIY
ncbi:unnamed protein product [Polarella glacialis]|uniref:Uncharacterized protein n=1 Tax=Polarella glacialis TaxID=89957 RepID=A0A813IDT9_POLGL|nr:unnamed protein product [Polarella glacialis]